MESPVQVLDDAVLLDSAMVVADDLYKSACTIDRWDESLSTYLAASVGTFFRLLGERGSGPLVMVHPPTHVWRVRLSVQPATQPLRPQEGAWNESKMEIDFNSWDHSRLTDYWAFKERAIDRHASDLGELDEPEFQAVSSLIADAITDDVGNLPEELLPAAAVAIVDDLYKSACVIDRWDDMLGFYLATSAGTFLREVASRGIRIQYLVDNIWDELERPVDLFPHWFNAAGLVYVCPQAIVPTLAEEDGRSGDVDAEELFNAYIDEARHVAGEIAARCQEEARHFVQLDCDRVENSFDQALSDAGAEGVVTISRVAAPEPGTHVKVWWPAGPAQDQGRDTLVEQVDVSNWMVASLPHDDPPVA